jgi:hypothetical protein
MDPETFPHPLITPQDLLFYPHIFSMMFILRSSNHSCIRVYEGLPRRPIMRKVKFTPLESLSIDAGHGRNRKHQMSLFLPAPSSVY